MRYYRESRMDTLARYRGVLTIVAIPVLLFLAVLLLSPGKSEYASSFNRSQPFSRVEYERTGATDKTERWAVVIDAGSTGSRVHIFKFLTGAGGNLELQFDKFDQLKPGLSSFADDPAGAAKSLKPLIDLAVATVPSSLQSSTPMMVGATAGLRLLPDGKADIILDEVRHYMRSFPFKFQDDDVKILSGVDEGAFAWLTLNYLLGHLGKPHTETVAAIDLGGGSVQEAFAMSREEAKSAPKADYVTHLRGGGQEYSVYVYSYLGYGLMAGRAAVLQEDPNGPEDDTHPCIHGGHTGEYEYGGKSFVAAGHDDGASHGECAVTVQNALKPQEKCGAPQIQCSFSGAWAGPRIPAVFYASSYFWDRAADAGLVNDDKHISAKVQPGHFESAALEACPLHVDSLEDSFPRVQESHRPFFCLDLTYAYTLLTHGFKIPKNKEITLVKKVEYKGETVEAAWPLGAAINLLN
ncbi:putative Apyrase 1 [Nannochloris sp. 'desiccata']|nr:hypothetical protein KSW81_000705 [Chlorella desiccata (nom. nud.)]KAH7620643.1 putative Apyrase 1 [Chlorella desiccata (nom. nud.)]